MKGLLVFQENLRAYLQEKRFDLYNQAPWIAASHMIEMLHFSMYEGIGLCCQTNIWVLCSTFTTLFAK
jgi:hypothetical protein